MKDLNRHKADLGVYRFAVTTSPNGKAAIDAIGDETAQTIIERCYFNEVDALTCSHELDRVVSNNSLDADLGQVSKPQKPKGNK